MEDFKEKVGKTADKLFTAVGTVMDPEYDGPGKKIVGAAEVAFGATGWVASKVIHKAQGPLGHWINKKIGQDPIADCADECAWLIKEGLDRFK